MLGNHATYVKEPDKVLFEDGQTLVKIVDITWSPSYPRFEMQLILDGTIVSRSSNYSGAKPTFRGKPLSFIKQRFRAKIKSLDRNIKKLEDMQKERDKIQAELDRFSK